MAAMTSFQAEKCCQLVSAYTTSGAASAISWSVILLKHISIAGIILRSHTHSLSIWLAITNGGFFWCFAVTLCQSQT